MRIVAVINYKGGVGKTTLTANLAAELAFRNYNVLIIDLDPQTNLTFSFVDPETWDKKFAPQKTIKNWFDSFEEGTPLSLQSLIITPRKVATYVENRGKLDLICSHLGLINVDLELATKLGGGTLSQNKRNFIKVHRRLADGLSELDDDAYDVALIDCPPNFNIVTKTAIVASDYILVPTRPDFLSTLGIDYLIRNVNDLVKNYNEYAELDSGDDTEAISPKIIGVVFTMIQEYANKPISSQRQFMTQTKRLAGLAVLPHYIKRNDTLFADAPQYGVPVVLHHYNTGSHQSVVDGLEAVTDDFCRSLEL